SSRTMSIAQQLYEGLDLGNEGTEGLITYMRTDSVRVEPVALNEARGYIKTTFGNEYLPEKPRSYSTKKNSQDAHEAIRPTNLHHHPELVRPYLTKEQFNLYSLIWKRFIASQMESAVYDTLSADIATDKGLMLRATGSVLKFQGYLAAYREREDDTDGSDEETALPDLQEGIPLSLVDIFSEQAFTRPPPRYTEASLVKELEKSGIGRPSTYAAIMNKIQSREYTVKESGRLKPTDLGRIIAQMLEDNFGIIMNIDFTANMEDTLELVAADKKDWRALLKDFWGEFEPVLETATKEATVPRLETDVDCPSCGHKLQKIWFKTKYFYGCSHYPECKFTAPVEELEFDKSQYAEDFDWDQKCPKCQSDMKLRFGKYGAFLGCTTYPECRGIVQIPKKGEVVVAEQDLPDCPAIGCPGKLTARRSRFGKTFYSCTTYPDCDVIVNSLEQVETKYPHHERTPYKKKTAAKKKAAPAKKTAKKRVMKASAASKELQAVIGVAEIDRAGALKKVWEYIKAKDLQNPENKREILPDEALSKVFGTKDKVPMTKVMGLVNKQLS
ncbi:MAG: topoisomerase DNA-binding C4 zinc finger domain-containing protein, partial [Chlamydiia bacterium]|nr:topoisomerase DNA-binding C4 zinc finger domain-containing protein [Chlamydiia bacterium]